MNDKIVLALGDLLQRIARGQEYPDAHSAVAIKYRVDGDALRDAYDRHCAKVTKIANFAVQFGDRPDHEGGID